MQIRADGTGRLPPTIGGSPNDSTLMGGEGGGFRFRRPKKSKIIILQEGRKLFFLSGPPAAPGIRSNEKSTYKAFDDLFSPLVSLFLAPNQIIQK